MSELIETKYNLSLADRTNIIKLYSENTSKLQLSKVYGISVKGISGFLNRNNVSYKEYRGRILDENSRKKSIKPISLYCSFIKNKSGLDKWDKRRLNEEKINEIIARYLDGDSPLMIARSFNTYKRNILLLLEKNNVSMRGRKENIVNHNAFKEINEQSAYWIGFLMADGGIYKNSVKLSIKDQEHLVKFREFTGNKKDIRPTKNNAYFFGVSSSEYVKDLAIYGVVPCKSHIAKARNNIEQNTHFWRGVIDGDGSIGFARTTPVLALVGSLQLLTQFKDYVLTICPQQKILPIKHSSVWRIAYYSSNAKTIIDNLYSNASVYLDRKYKRAMSILDGKIGFDE